MITCGTTVTQELRFTRPMPVLCITQVGNKSVRGLWSRNFKHCGYCAN